MHRLWYITRVNKEKNMDRHQALKDFLRQYTDSGIALAFSGGTDSTLLLAVLAEMYREKPFPLAALSMHSIFQTPEELNEVKKLAAGYAVPLQIFTGDPLQIPEVKGNLPDRCYHCKKFIFSTFRNYAREHGLEFLLDGTHAGDRNVYRPGRKALAELGVISPLAELGMDKPEIRELAKKLKAAVSDKPAAPCLATRFDYGTLLTPELLKKVSAGEAILRQYLPENTPLRLRVHGDIARIEIPADAMLGFLDHREEISRKLQEQSFRFITLDLQGFRSGSYDIPGKH